MNTLSFVEARREELLRALGELVDRESPSSDKSAVDLCGEKILSLFASVTADIRTFSNRDVGDFHLITCPASSSASKDASPLLVLTHSDTVWPVGTLRSRPFRIDGRRAFGPGTLDMKSGLVMAWFAVKSLEDLSLKPRRPVRIFINSAEEIGHPDAAALIRDLAESSRAVLCLEPALPGGALKVRRKGRLVVRIDVTGRAGHAGSPENGVSAVDELILQLGTLRILRRGDITMNIGRLDGGDKVNVVAEHAWSLLDIRYFTSEEKDFVIRTLQGLRARIRGAEIGWTTESDLPALEPTPESTRLARQIQDIGAELGFPLTTGQTGGGSDASIAAQSGVPAVDGLGPDGGGIHAEDEHVLIASLIQRTALLMEILKRL